MKIRLALLKGSRWCWIENLKILYVCLVKKNIPPIRRDAIIVLKSRFSRYSFSVTLLFWRFCGRSTELDKLRERFGIETAKKLIMDGSQMGRLETNNARWVQEKIKSRWGEVVVVTAGIKPSGNLRESRGIEWRTGTWTQWEGRGVMGKLLFNCKMMRIRYLVLTEIKRKKRVSYIIGEGYFLLHSGITKGRKKILGM